jgi:hypothetical protein
MDATSTIIELHGRIERLFHAYDNAHGSPVRQVNQLHAIADVLAVHATVEDELLYPAVRAETAEYDAEIDRELEQHNVMSLLLVELGSMSPNESRYDAKVQVLKQVFHQHARDQEDTLLPLLRGALGPVEGAALGQRLWDRGARLENPKEPAWSLR